MTLAALFATLATSSAARADHPTEFRDAAEARGHVPADLPLRPVRPRRFEQPGAQRLPIVRRLRQDRDGLWAPAAGALSGKSVYLSPGHGWTWGSSAGWYTQRPNLYGLTEDLSNADGIDQFLVPLLLGAGAFVVPVREIDPTTELVILDDSDGAKTPARGRYVESGDAAAFSDSTLKGWGHPTLPLTGAQNPFALGGNRLLTAAAKETARATYVLNVPRSGQYNVHVSHSMYTSRASDAHVSVVHAGGTTRFLVDQRRQGGTWVLLGRFHFATGTDEKTGAVIVTNESQDAGATVAVDAVRLGGGMGLIDRGGGVSKVARAEENCRYHAQFAGAPESVYNASTSEDGTDDVSARSRFAQWAHAAGEPAVYLSHHSNASGATPPGTARGTVSYVYGTNAVDGTYQPTATTLALGSDKLAKAVQSQIVADLRASWDPAWKDRGLESAYFGELNTSHQDEMPSMLLELAFHDELQDVAALKEAPFRRIVARAIYKGIARYFAGQEGTAPVFLPDAPTGIRARNSGPGEITVSWDAPATGAALGGVAESYRVYTSRGGYGFDEGADSGGKTALVLRGLTPGAVLYLRVGAVNKGGESLPSPTLAVGVAAGGAAAPLLLVGAFDRFDAALNPLPTYPKLGSTNRLFVERINDGSYLVQHGAALAGTKVPFDACLHEAVARNVVVPKSYRLVIWQGGKGLEGNKAPSLAERSALAAAAAGGTALALSGATLARALGGPQATADEQLFLVQTLHAGFVSTQAASGKINAAAGALWGGLAAWDLAGPQSGPYDVQLPDVLAAASGSTTAAAYEGAGLAAVQHRAGQSCVVLLGFPLEAVLPAERQAELLARVLAHCDVKAPPAPDGGVRDGGVVVGDGRLPGGELPPPANGDGGDPGGCGCVVSGAPPVAAAATAALSLALLGLLGVPLSRGVSRRRARRRQPPARQSKRRSYSAASSPPTASQE